MAYLDHLAVALTADVFVILPGAVLMLRTAARELSAALRLGAAVITKLKEA